MPSVDLRCLRVQSAQRRRRGLTLVEVLIAVVIAGGALALAAAGVSAAVRAEAHAGDLSLAATHLELLLGRVEAGVLPLSNAEGTFEEDGAADLRWSVVVTPGEREGLTDALLTVRWTRLGLERELSVSRLIYIEPETGR